MGNTKEMGSCEVKVTPYPLGPERQSQKDPMLGLTKWALKYVCLEQQEPSALHLIPKELQLDMQ